MTMVEKLARANYDRRQQIGWECGIAPTSWEDAGPSTRAMEKDCARAALSAMMEPTPGMVEAGASCALGWVDETEMWQAMIRTALAEGEG